MTPLLCMLSYRGFTPLPADEPAPSFFRFPAPGEPREDRGRDSRPPALLTDDTETKT